MKKRISGKIETAAQAAAVFRAALPDMQREERVFVLPLDGNGEMLSEPILVSVGVEAGTAAVDAGRIFREALKAGSEEIIVAHNHPSGDMTPSEADFAVTRELKDLASRLSVTFVDHLIVGPTESFVSLAEMMD